MNDELRESLARFSSEALAAIVARRDDAEWRPEVFAVAEAILRERSEVSAPEQPGERDEPIAPEPAAKGREESTVDPAPDSGTLVGVTVQTEELRRRLSGLWTRRLAAIVARHDVEEWSPEALGIAEAMLRERGAVPSAQEPLVTAPDRSVEPAAGGQADDLTLLMELPNASLVPVVKSLLLGENIRFFISNEEAQGLLAAGQFALGYNPITGPPTLFVESSRTEEARVLLAGLFEKGGADRA